MAKDTHPLTRHEQRRLKEIGERLRALRESKGLTLEEVEARGYPSWKHLQALESGRKNFTITSLYRLSSALEVSPSDVLKKID